MPGRHHISIEELTPRIGAPDQPAIIDVRTEEDFALAPRLIPGARRTPHLAVEALASSLTGRHAVLICHKGLKLSQGAAALLRCRGVFAAALTGGMVGWLAAGGVTRAAEAPDAWVAPEGAGPEVMAAAWALRRFVDPGARLMFVAPDQAEGVEDRFAAAGLGDLGDFLAKMELDSPPLRAVCAALTGPEAPGLEAIERGLSALAQDDLTRLALSMSLYDALFRRAVDAHERARRMGASA